MAVPRMPLAVQRQGAGAGAPTATVELEGLHGKGIEPQAQKPGGKTGTVIQLHRLAPLLAITIALTTRFVAVTATVVGPVAVIPGEVLVIEKHPGLALGEQLLPGLNSRLADTARAQPQPQQHNACAIHGHGTVPCQ